LFLSEREINPTKVHSTQKQKICYHASFHDPKYRNIIVTPTSEVAIQPKFVWKLIENQNI